MKGYKIPLLRTPIQEKIPLNTPLKETQKFRKEMLEKRTIEKVWQHKDQYAQKQFLSNLFLLRKKDWGYRPLICTSKWKVCRL